MTAGTEPVTTPATTGELVEIDGVVLPAATLARIRGATDHAQAAGTVRAYASAWSRFETWCTAHGHTPLPAAPIVIAAYLVDAADTVTESGERAYSPATLSTWVAAIADRHRRTAGPGDGPVPTAHELVRATLAGIRREYAAAGDRPRVPRAPLLTDDIMNLVTVARAEVTGWASEVYERRDSAILLLGYAGSLRRSELAALAGGDITLHPDDGAHLALRRSKTDQDGYGTVHALPRAQDPVRCPPCAYVRWAAVVAASDRGGRRAVIRLLTTAAPIDAGHVCTDPATAPKVAARRPLLRAIRQNGLLGDAALSGAAVHAVVRRRAELAGYPNDQLALLGAHSLRAGFVTQARRNGATPEEVMAQTDHHTAAMVERYRRDNAPLIGNAVIRLGL